MSARTDRVPAARRVRRRSSSAAPDGPRGRADRGRRRDRRRRPGRAGLRDPADAAARGRREADGVARRGARSRWSRRARPPGSHLMSGAMMHPSAMEKLFPDLDRGGLADVRHGRQGRRVYFLTNGKRAIPLQADAAAVPQPRQPRHVGRAARPLPRREGRGGGRLHPPRDRGLQAAGRGRQGRRRPHGRQGPRPRGRGARQLRARLGRDRQGDRAAPRAPRATWPARRSATSTSAPSDPQQWELGVKEVWEVKKPLDRVIHSIGWPLRFAAKYREFGGSFIYPMGEDKVSIGLRGRPRLPRRHASRSTTLLQQFKTHPMVTKHPRGRQARRLGRQDDPVRRLLGDAEAAVGARA